MRWINDAFFRAEKSTIDSLVETVLEAAMVERELVFYWELDD